jgi:hypothetical protein
MTSQIAKVVTRSLYDRDYCLWLEQAVGQLQNRQFEGLDLKNLIEELESMGRREKDAIESNLQIVLMHLLKYRYQPEKRSRSWLSSIYEHRRRLGKAFRHSPSLKRYLAEVFDECYQDARKIASLETGLPLETFPKQSPFSQEETLNPDYLPD